jgi:hypothetical protein
MKIKGLRYILAVGLAFSLCGCSVWNRVTVPNETASKEAEITESFTDSDINSPQDADNNSEQNIAAASASTSFFGTNNPFFPFSIKNRAPPPSQSVDMEGTPIAIASINALGIPS